MDGGVRSPTNADLAAGYARVVIVAPLGSNTELGASLRREEAFLRQQGASVRTIEADAEALAAFGPNVLDPARRRAAAEAGLRQATALGPGVLD
jgi:NTE family protein